MGNTTAIRNFRNTTATKTGHAVSDKLLCTDYLQSLETIANALGQSINSVLIDLYYKETGVFDWTPSGDNRGRYLKIDGEFVLCIPKNLNHDKI